MPDLTKPVWSVPAGETETLAISSGHMLVDAPAGKLVLRTSDGSVTAHEPSDFDESALAHQANGLGVV